MFPGRTNNDMLRLQMSVKGRVPAKLIRNHIKSYEVLQLEPHFDESTSKFRQWDTDAVTKKPVLKLVDINHPTKDLGAILRQNKVRTLSLPS